MVDIPVNGEVLAWARNFRGLDPASAADRIGISTGDLEDFERGIKTPSLTVFESFARAYQLPQSTLFRRSRPKEPELPTDFRTFDGQKPKFGFDFLVAVSNVRTLQNALHNLSLEDDEFSYPDLPRLNRKGDPEELGERERQRIGITVSDQLGWSAGDGFSRWRAVLERLGVTVYLEKFDLNDSRGFTVLENENLAAIVINRSEPYERARTFTLIHEYAHLLIREPGISDLKFRNPVESFCNKFAAAFLMPREALRAVLPIWPNEPVDWDTNTIRWCASRLKVSQMALALRLQEMGFAPSNFFARFNWGSGYNPPRKTEGGGSYVAIRLSEVGSRYAGAVIDAFDRGAVGTVAASQALNLSEEQFPKVRTYVERRRETADGE